MARGSLEKRGQDTYRMVVSAGFDAMGKRVKMTRTFHGSKRDADKALAALVLEAEKGVPTGDTTMGEWIDYFFAARANLAPRTREVYEAMAKNRILPAFTHKRLKDITPQNLRDFFHKMRTKKRMDGREGAVGAASLGKYYRFLHVLFAEALRAGHVASNPLDAVEKPGGEKASVKYLNDNELAEVMKKLAVQPITTRLPFTLLLTTGMRRGELLALRWQDIDMDSGVIRVDKAVGRIKGGQEVKATKTAGSVRTVYALPEVIELLKAWQQQATVPNPEGYIFAWPKDGAWWHIDYLSKAWIGFCRDNELPEINLHGLRHTAASIMIAGGLPVTEAARALGHASPATTGRIYSHVMNDAAKRAMEVIGKSLSPKLSPSGDNTTENTHET